MAYAAVSDVQDRIGRNLSDDELELCEHYLKDAAVIIDIFAPNAGEEAKYVVSCRMVIRKLGDGTDSGIPIGASQGTQSALGYSQTWTYSTGSSGELYLSKLDKQMLGCGSKIGAYNPLAELVPEEST